MSDFDVPLSPDDLAAIERVVEGLDDPKLEREFRAKATKRYQAEANAAALDRRRYREAIEFAHLNGHPDPEAYASEKVAEAKVIDLYEARVRAVQKRVQARHVKRVDKAASKRAKASKSANPNLRRHPQDDRLYVDIIGKAEREGYLDNVPLVLSIIASKFKSTSKPKPKKGGYRLPHWEKTTLPLKVLAMSVESAKHNARTINLRLNPEICAEALRSPRGPASYMQDRIRRQMEGAFEADAPDFWLIIERDNDQQVHVHGAVEVPAVAGGDKLVDDALRAAGGKWDASGGQMHQQKSRLVTEPIYLASYVCKLMNLTGMMTDRKLFASTSGLRSRAALGWDHLRATLPQTPR